MTLARRLLRSGRGGGGFTPSPSVFTALTSGGWTIIPHPKAYYYNGKTYIGWAHGSTGNVHVASYAHATETASTPFTLHTAAGVDTHNAPAVLVRDSDKRIVVAYCEQNDTSVKVRISTNVEDTSAFGSPITAVSGSSYTYVSLVQLTGVTNDPIYLFYTKAIDKLAFVKSTDGGATWGSETVLVDNAANVYWKVGTDWDTRIDVFVTDAAPTSSNLYHFYINGSAGTYHQSGGSSLSPPFAASSATVVLSNASGACWSFGASWDGAPACIIMQENGSSDNRIKVARWRSGEWQVDTVTNSVGGQFAGDKYFSGCGIDHADPNTVYVAEKSTVFEIVRYLSFDDGATWVRAELTGASAEDNVMPQVPVHSASGLRAFWLHGDLVSSADYDFAVHGLR